MDDAATARLAPFSETVPPASGSDSVISGETTVGVALAAGVKCARCWNYSEKVPSAGGAVAGTAAELCERCGPVVSLLGFKPPAAAVQEGAMTAAS